MPTTSITRPALNFTPGTVSTIPDQPEKEGYQIFYSNPTLNGMSGGAVLNEDGKLVGIHGQAESLEGTEETRTGRNGAIPSALFMPLLGNVTSSIREIPSPIAPPTITNLSETNTNLTVFQNAILARHNYYRSKHGVPLLTLDTQLNNEAQQWANTLASTQQFKHSGVVGQGENLYLSATTANTLPDITTQANNAVDSWYNEIGQYNYSNPGFSSTTGHFTQVMWKSTTNLGCGIASGKYQGYNGRYVVCRYTPPGNYTGQFPQNVLPLIEPLE
jgi:uncharacterized protein YkwD